MILPNHTKHYFHRIYKYNFTQPYKTPIFNKYNLVRPYKPYF